MEKAKEKMVANRPYEVVLLMHPDSTVEEQKELFKRNKSIIEAGKGSVFSVETWGKRNLANPIKKHRKAYYFHSMFETQPEVIAELERTMRINDRVMRFVHTRLDERVPISKHLEIFKQGLQETTNREKEREAKIQLKKAQAAAAAAERAEGRFDRFDKPEKY